MLAIQDRTDFENKTLLDRQAFVDMACFQPQGNARPIGEARNAFATESIFRDPVLKAWLLELYKSYDRFNFISRVFIRDNLRRIQANQALSKRFVNEEPMKSANDRTNALYESRQRQIEEELAMRVARLHNGGGAPFAPDPSTLTRKCAPNVGPCDLGDYVKSYIGVTPGRGDWRSLRCADTDARWRALEMTPIRLN
jgi:hypothetical protein